MKKYVVIRKIWRKTMKKGCPKYESDNANKVKNELKLDIDEQQDAIKHLKEYYDIDDIESPWKDKAVCKTCNQPFAWKNGWKNIFRKSTLRCCEIILAKSLNKEKNVISHMDNEFE